jgi:hypothetical protein
MGRYYILRGTEVIEEPDYAKWADWYENTYEKVRRVAATKLQYSTVSTVFLAMHMTLVKDGPPLLFETRVEGGHLDDEWERYATLEEAQAGHEAWVARVQAAEKDRPPPPGWPAW